jgi:hypothetical protein
MIPATTLSYILDGPVPVAEPDPDAWRAWMRAAQLDGRRIVAKTQINPRLEVSTVFTGMDRGPAGSPGFERPIVFESATFEDGEVVDTRGYTSWEDAQAGHAALVATLGGSA